MSDVEHLEIHPPKVEFFDIAALTNTDPKGFVRAVEAYRVESWGLYMARLSDHPSFHYLESWLLPSLGLRASIFHYRTGHERDQDYYIDIGEFTRGPREWTSVDLYLDVVVRTGRGLDLLDGDELLEARVAGHIDTARATLAFTRAAAAIAGIARHGYDLDAWLASLDMPTSWRGRSQLGAG